MGSLKDGEDQSISTAISAVIDRATERWMIFCESKKIGRDIGLFAALLGLNRSPGVRSADADHRISHAWRDCLAPVFRKHGFSGSGNSFRAVSGDFALIITLQVNRYGGSFAVNLGIHPLGAPDVVGEVIEFAKIKDHHCAARHRLSASGSDMWWLYREKPESMRLAAHRAAVVFEQMAEVQFDELKRFMLTAVPGDIEQLHPLAGICFAIFRDAQGRTEEAKAFARNARERAQGRWPMPGSIRHMLDN